MGDIEIGSIWFDKENQDIKATVYDFDSVASIVVFECFADNAWSRTGLYKSDFIDRFVSLDEMIRRSAPIDPSDTLINATALIAAINALKLAIDDDSVISLVKAAYKIVDLVPASEVSK